MIVYISAGGFFWVGTGQVRNVANSLTNVGGLFATATGQVVAQ